jgi:hypothetical protein
MELYQIFEEHKDEINSQLGINSSWEPLEKRKASRIRFTRDVRPKESTQNLCKWLVDEMIKSKEVFTKYSR